jgi:hypothetical protein
MARGRQLGSVPRAVGHSPQSNLACDSDSRSYPIVCKHELRHLVIIEARHSEVRLDPNRETYGHGQGSGLSGKAESRVAGFHFAPFTAAN